MDTFIVIALDDSPPYGTWEYSLATRQIFSSREAAAERAGSYSPERKPLVIPGRWEELRAPCTIIKSLQDLADFLGARSTDIASLNHRIYKDTECGASISIYGYVPGQSAINKPLHAFHNGHRGGYHEGFVPTSFTIQTIVEGSEATVDGPRMVFGVVSEQDVDEFIGQMETEAERLWGEANHETEEG